MTTRVFVNPSGQRDNLGDSVLRRAYLNSLRACGELHVYVGTDAAYISGLGLSEFDVTYESKKSWLVAGLLGARGDRMIFALNAGEIVMDRRFMANSIWQRALSMAAKMQGGATIALGISVRPHPLIGQSTLKGLLKGARVVAWRDKPSRDRFDRGIVAPDWAFELGRSTESLLAEHNERSIVAVSVRGDRPTPPDEWFASVREYSASLGADIVAVVQVKRDAERANELAQRLGGTVLEWNDESHAEQELRVRELYGKCHSVVSDRIHALIIGFTEGAVPIGITPGSTEKVQRTFAAVTPVSMSFSATQPGRSVEQTIADATNVATRKTELIQDLGRARARLGVISAQLRSLE